MARLKAWVREFWDSDSGATATEYAVMIALVVLICMAAISALGEKVSDSFADAEKGFPDIADN